MRTNIVIDDQLMAQAMKVGGFKTKREAVEAGLRKLVQAKRYQEIIELHGKIDWVGDLEEMRLDKPRQRSRRK
jgi:Arc/MetJ family transcription regulator